MLELYHRLHRKILWDASLLADSESHWDVVDA
jgi:hypothetical protein